jgi:hypothetical protein
MVMRIFGFTLGTIFAAAVLAAVIVRQSHTSPAGSWRAMILRGE